MSVTSARQRTPAATATPRRAAASSRASATVLRKAPDPHLTSRIRVPAPRASFFDMMEPTISGSDGTAATMSRRAYSVRSAGAMPTVWAMIAAPQPSMSSSVPRRSRRDSQPGIAPSLSSVPWVWPSPRPAIIATGTPTAASSGARTSEMVSPTPPVECLSTTSGRSAARFQTSPECSISSVSQCVSSALIPRQQMAISIAASCSRGTESSTAPRTKARICPRSRAFPSRLAAIASTKLMRRPRACRQPSSPSFWRASATYGDSGNSSTSFSKVVRARSLSPLEPRSSPSL